MTMSSLKRKLLLLFRETFTRIDTATVLYSNSWFSLINGHCFHSFVRYIYHLKALLHLAGSTLGTRNEWYSSMFVSCSLYVLLLSAKCVRDSRCSLQIHNISAGLVISPPYASVTGPLIMWNDRLFVNDYDQILILFASDLYYPECSPSSSMLDMVCLRVLGYIICCTQYVYWATL